MTRLLYNNSEFKVFLRMSKNSCAESSVNACKAYAANKNRNINPLIMNLSRLLRKNLGSFMQLSTVIYQWSPTFSSPLTAQCLTLLSRTGE